LRILRHQLLQARLFLRRAFTGQDFHCQDVKFWVHYSFSKSKSVFEKSFLVAQATRLYRPATRRTEWERRFEPMGTAFSQGCSPQFRSAGRRPERASRPRYLFLNNRLRLRVRVRVRVRKSHWKLDFITLGKAVSTQYQQGW